MESVSMIVDNRWEVEFKNRDGRWVVTPGRYDTEIQAIEEMGKWNRHGQYHVELRHVFVSETRIPYEFKAAK